MTFFYYEINTRRFIQSTNIAALEEFSGISYHKIWNWFNNGSNIHVDDSIICGCSNLVRGKQRIQKVEVRRVFPLTADQTGPIESSYSVVIENLPKRQTKQPDNRNMKDYDDFFKEVK